MVNNISFSALYARSRHVPRPICCTCSVLYSRESGLAEYRFSVVTFQSLKYKKSTKTERGGRYAITIPSQSSSSPPYCLVRFVFGNVFGLGTKKLYNEDCMLVNVIQGEVLRLPTLIETSTCDHSQFTMGFDDKTNTYKILCATNHQLVPITAHILVLGTKECRKVSSISPPELKWALHHEPVCANGAVHWWHREIGRIISFDFSRQEFFYTPAPPTSSNTTSRMTLFILRGFLAITEMAVLENKYFIDSIEIWVLKDYDKNQWVKYYSNNKVKDAWSFDYNGSTGEWEHGIFVTDYNIKSDCCNTIYIMDLRTGSINRVKRTYYTLLGMCSYSETLISLGDYGNLEETHKGKLWDVDED